MQIGADGNLVGTLEDGGELTWRRPIAYQELEGIRQEVRSRYVLFEENRVTSIGFELGPYDRTRPLVIEPVLEYSTFLDGLGEEAGRGIAVDQHGHAYVTGSTSSLNFPTSRRPFQATFGEGQNAFVTMFNRDGSGIIFSTYLGGTDGEDVGLRIALGGDQDDVHAYVLGSTSSTDFPVTEDAYQTEVAGSSDAFIVKLSRDGRKLEYSTYLGGTTDENVDGSGGIAVLNGNAYVTGSTDSVDFPTTPGAFQRINGGENGVFVARLSSSERRLLYSTYLGGEGYDYGQALFVDAAGNAFVTGGAASLLFPTTTGPVAAMPLDDPDVIDVENAFAAKLNPRGTDLVYSTLFGGAAPDAGTGIAVDSRGRAYLTGATASPNFPTTSGSFQTQTDGPPRADNDAFVLKLNQFGTAILYSTYLGGTGFDMGVGVAIDREGNAYVVGHTTSTDFPIRSGFQTMNRGDLDVFVAKVNLRATALVYSGYLGGVLADSAEGQGIARDRDGAVYLIGQTTSANFPTTRRAFQRTSGGGASDAFVSKVAGSSPSADPHRCDRDHDHDWDDRHDDDDRNNSRDKNW